ncbi:MAG: tRNA (5-methylaminomethyl-2-thiouridine)(34)-methyltransferase MnmD [Cytophagales bacterium]|nr:tRNA (5-methylaminomethyl-2-thiouridine)(34)-methyltransferase MnmD [Cytophagales bacterium]
MSNIPALEIQATNDGSHTLYRADLDETYHSHKGALGESEYVFIDKGLEHFLNESEEKEITVFEVGLGTGLNALLSAQFAAKRGIKVHFHSVEPFPVPEAIYQQLNYASDEDDRLLFQAIHKSSWETAAAISEHFHLSKYEQKLEDFTSPISVDVVFMDAFAPSKQAEVWALENLEKCYGLLNKGGILVTYCAQGQFKRNLKACGFELEVLPGALGKKEMVRAIKG